MDPVFLRWANALVCVQLFFWGCSPRDAKPYFWVEGRVLDVTFQYLFFRRNGIICFMGFEIFVLSCEDAVVDVSFQQATLLVQHLCWRTAHCHVSARMLEKKETAGKAMVRPFSAGMRVFFWAEFSFYRLPAAQAWSKSPELSPATENRSQAGTIPGLVPLRQRLDRALGYHGSQIFQLLNVIIPFVKMMCILRPPLLGEFFFLTTVSLFCRVNTKNITEDVTAL